ncbi:MAG: ABC transporter ATP-binding protein [Peptococcaceae bacterium]
METILEVNNLRTSFFTRQGEVEAVRGISFNVGRGETVGIIGESGSGKTTAAFSILDLLPYPGRIIDGSVLFKGKELLSMSEQEKQLIRGNEISIIFQDPLTSLNPVFSIGDQIMEPLRRHQKLKKAEARQKAVQMLDLVGMPSSGRELGKYPHQFSGGMRQRVMIALALSCQPRLLIADEPTTALDVTIQAQILELLQDLTERFNTAIILITHDLGVIAEICSRTVVMYGGLIVEQGTTREIFYDSRHPYTGEMLKLLPKIQVEQQEKLIPIAGRSPNPIKPPAGCPFCPRCGHAMNICSTRRPPVIELSSTHRTACWLLHPAAPQTEGSKRSHDPI